MEREKEDSLIFWGGDKNMRTSDDRSTRRRRRRLNQKMGGEACTNFLESPPPFWLDNPFSNPIRGLDLWDHRWKKRMKLRGLTCVLAVAHWRKKGQRSENRFAGLIPSTYVYPRRWEAQTGGWPERRQDML